MLKRKLTEAQVQKHFNDKVKWLREVAGRESVFHVKLSDRYQSGLPDNVLIFRSKTYWVELKRPTEEPTPLQAKRGRDIVHAGGVWMWFSSKEGIDGFFERIFLGDTFRKGVKGYSTTADLEEQTDFCGQEE